MTQNSWLLWALLSAVLAAATAILAKAGLRGVDADVATLLRSVVISLVLVAFLASAGRLEGSLAIARGTWVFLVLSGLAAALSWLCYFRALAIGNATQVATVDKLSLVFTALLAVAFLGERPTGREWLGVGLVTAGILIFTIRK